MKGALSIGEYHPASKSAMEYVRKKTLETDFFILKESIASTAIDGNRCSEICLETLTRIETGQNVSDRYLLGLAWFLRDIEDFDKNLKNKHA